MVVRENISERDLGWICGLFEGEGSISTNGSHGKKLNITSTDRDVVERFARIIGCGRVAQDLSKSRQEKMKHGAKSVYTWTVSNWREIRPILLMMLPLMSDRRKQKFEAALNDPPQAWRDRGHLTGVYSGEAATELLMQAIMHRKK